MRFMCPVHGNPEYVTIFDAQGNVIMQPPMAFPGSTVLNATFVNPCLDTNQIPICTEVAVYQTGSVSLPAITGGYYIVYQRCCRTGSLYNLVGNGTEGASYVAHIPDPSLATCDNAPRFNQLPPKYMCVNAPLTIDYSATDPDGDSLVYSLCNPYDGADQSLQCTNPSPAAQPGCPTAPPAPADITCPGIHCQPVHSHRTVLQILRIFHPLVTSPLILKQDCLPVRRTR